MMRSIVTLLLLQLFVYSPACWAQSGVNDRVIELKGGDRILVRADGSMTHYDGAGDAVAMPEGVIMVAKDGSRIMMKGQAIWREIVYVATRSYALVTSVPNNDRPANARAVQLKDGGRILVSADGAMVHYDAAGNRHAMPDGETMIAKDGSRILMNNGSLWSSK